MDKGFCSTARSLDNMGILKTIVIIIGVCFACAKETGTVIKSDTNKEDSGAKVYNGRDAVPNSYPWMAWIMSNSGTFRCGGSLISDRYVLTAGHCVKHGVLGVILGDHIRSNVDGREQASGVSRYIRHPEYNDIPRNNDIALLELANPVNTSSEYVKPIPLVSEQSFIDKFSRGKKVGRLSGWGKNKYSSGWEFSDTLQEMRIVGISDDDCDTLGYYRTPTVMCYRSKKSVASTCSGDSGSPLVCKRKGEWVQVGLHIFSHPKDGCTRGVKGATKLSSVISWINQYIY